MNKKGRFEPPEATALDLAHTATRVALGYVPGVGTLLSEGFAAFIAPPLERRKSEWMTLIGEAVSRLESEGVNLESLQSNEQFISTLMQASHAAMRSHQAEKLEALRNAVVNSAFPDAPEDSMQQMFLNLVDRLTPWHLRILRMLQNPEKWISDHGKTFPQVSIGGSLSDVLLAAFPELTSKGDFYDQIVKELHDYGLTSTGSFHGMMSASGLRAGRTKALGDTFISFIADRPKK